MVETLGRRLVVTLVSLFFAALVVVFLSRVTTILVLLFISVLLSVFFSAFTDILVRRVPLGRPFVLGIASLLTLGAIVGIGWLIVPPVGLVRILANAMKARPSSDFGPTSRPS